MDETVFAVTALIAVGAAATAFRILTMLGAEVEQECQESSDGADPIW